jgi:hypothetical protein
MPKRNKGGLKKTPSRAVPITPKPNGHSLIVRSAESLGRMIAALQLQLERIGEKTGGRGAATRVKKGVQSARKTTAKGNPRNTGGKAAPSAKGD